METPFTDWQRQPRALAFRMHYKWYAGILCMLWLGCLACGVYFMREQAWAWEGAWQEQLMASAAMAVLAPVLYLTWLHGKLTRTVQVFSDRVRVSSPGLVFDIPFHELEGISRPLGSFMRLELRDGSSWWFSAAMERPDYLWEALWRVRPELVGNAEIYEDFRLRLVQCDHHEKRKEWFFRHRFVDVLNWVGLPVLIMAAGYHWQSQDVVIQAKGLYFFRLAMFNLIATIACAFVFSLALKRFVFDRAVKEGLAEGDKKRDLAWEGLVLQRAKILQLCACALVMGGVLHTQANLFSVTRLREGAQVFKLKPGKTVVVDNRYNCMACAHSVKDGDLLVFGRGTIGQVLALSGEVIAQTRQGDFGRTIASETLTEVPTGQVALRTGPQGKDVVLVKLDELVGKIENP